MAGGAAALPCAAAANDRYRRAQDGAPSAHSAPPATGIEHRGDGYGADGGSPPGRLAAGGVSLLVAAGLVLGLPSRHTAASSSVPGPNP